MKRVNQEGNRDMLVDSPESNISCPFCNCNFSFKEDNIEIVYEGIPYEKGIKKLFSMNKDTIIHRYVTCPWCRAKLKLKFVVAEPTITVYFNQEVNNCGTNKYKRIFADDK